MWGEHFDFDTVTSKIIGKTGAGRATILCLQMNTSGRLLPESTGCVCRFSLLISNGKLASSRGLGNDAPGMRFVFALSARKTAIFAVLGAFAGLFWAGCKGISTEGERRAQEDLRRVSESYRPGNQRPVLPTLQNNGGLSNFLAFAIFNQPQVEAAYFDWAASVQRITVERSLPDPRLTFESDIAETVMTVMPGLMMDFPGPGKLKWAGNIASAESRAKYFAFESSVLQTAFALKKAYYQLHFLNAKIGVNKQTLDLVNDLERLTRAQNEGGRVTLQDVLRAQIEQDRLRIEIENLEDSRNPLLAQFKSALGLKPEQAAPPIPEQFESTSLDLTAERLFETALARNPRLKAMQSEVERAEASLRLAYKARVPDFTVGLEADAKASPVMFRPQAAMTLPIWRDKVAAKVGEAEAARRAAEARLNAEQIMLAVDFAEKSFMFRESSRNLTLLQNQLLPKATQALQVARGGYSGGTVDFINFIDAERTLLNFRLSEIEARIQRELALADLSLLILGIPPEGARVLMEKPAPQSGATISK
jgi:cobalt-zinc-cadmium efflux system outer membrane protein